MTVMNAAVSFNFNAVLRPLEKRVLLVQPVEGPMLLQELIIPQHARHRFAIFDIASSYPAGPTDVVVLFCRGVSQGVVFSPEHPLRLRVANLWKRRVRALGMV